MFNGRIIEKCLYFDTFKYLLENNYKNFQFFSEERKNDLEIVKTFIKILDKEFNAEKYNNIKDLYMHLINLDVFSSDYYKHKELVFNLPVSLRNDDDVVMAFLNKKNYAILSYIDKEKYNDSNFLKKIFSLDLNIYFYIPNNLKDELLNEVYTLCGGIISKKEVNGDIKKDIFDDIMFGDDDALPF